MIRSTPESAPEAGGRVQGSPIGRHRAVARSQCRDFLEYRAYAPGDDFREIDWRTSGRVGRVVGRQTEGEKRLGLMVALDASGAYATGNFGAPLNRAGRVEMTTKSVGIPRVFDHHPQKA